MLCLWGTFYGGLEMICQLLKMQSVVKTPVSAGFALLCQPGFKVPVQVKPFNLPVQVVGIHQDATGRAEE